MAGKVVRVYVHRSHHHSALEQLHRLCKEQGRDGLAYEIDLRVYRTWDDVFGLHHLRGFSGEVLIDHYPLEQEAVRLTRQMQELMERLGKVKEGARRWDELKPEGEVIITTYD